MTQDNLKNESYIGISLLHCISFGIFGAFIMLLCDPQHYQNVFLSIICLCGGSLYTACKITVIKKN